MGSSLKIKRIYDAAEEQDGARVLVDRVWPRGIAKDKAALAAWLKDLAPSTNLRKWFGHRTEHWAEFQRRYAAELDANPEAQAPLTHLMEQGTVTLLFGARDLERNNAVALKNYMERTAEGANA
ncbi:hypothetical protein GCM10007276_31860 [Agaricicola taiwanensis]|uniref:DUF488 domain-containing protein n=1 Tax=Agaricicola taiwanensis TaxID=591372 RepID=A0A8J2YM69_9RHOB|nr:DUF488 family protein [Agaricicola taiwanensis]GGE52471.1 hypothetical protein GCM10007276_31860 [Agaricicola taiwanensis]